MAGSKEDALGEEEGRGAWLLTCAGAAFGAAGGCHHVIAVLLLPSLCYYVFAASTSAGSGFRNVWNCAMPALVVMLGLYGAMFRVACLGPLWSWGAPNTPQVKE